MTSPAKPHDARNVPLAVHIMMLLSVATGFAGIAAAVIAHLSLKRVDEDMKSHLEYALRTFWIGFVVIIALFAFALSFTLTPFEFLPVYGRILYFLVSLWIVVRSLIGILRLMRGRAIPNPQTLWAPAVA